MILKPSTPEAYRLILDGSAAFADIEQNGICIDVPYVDRMLDETASLVRKMEGELRADAIYQTWLKIYGEKTDLGNRNQLADIVFNTMGIKSTKTTEKGKIATDVEAFEEVDLPFVRRWFDMQKLLKVRNTYLLDVKRETTGGRLRPSFNLHLVITFRSSCDGVNFQNWPNRDPRQRKIVRRCVIPSSPDHVLLSVDYGALEFRGAAMFWKDPQMIAYASDPKLDIHRDMSAICYMLDVGQVAKEIRSIVKNQFVFPTLYGSYYKNTGHALWTFIHRHKMKRKDGVGLYDHLAEKGIKTEEDFIDHMRTVDEDFNDMFPEWSARSERWWADYQRIGGFPLMTGFWCYGVFGRNFLMNAPVQGPSFHLMLWSVIQMNKWLKENRMRTKIIGQVHDSMELDAHRDEVQDVLTQLEYIMTVAVRKAWDWVIVPLVVEASIGETDWYDMVPIVRKNDCWEKLSA